jgi:glucosamine-6-phosphate deaminase
MGLQEGAKKSIVLAHDNSLRTLAVEGSNDISEIEMAIPMSPDQVMKKRNGIFIHQSQKDMVPFQGDDSREFWQRAEERNSNTANLYAKLGLTKYAAIEAFVRWHF